MTSGRVFTAGDRPLHTLLQLLRNTPLPAFIVAACVLTLILRRSPARTRRTEQLLTASAVLTIALVAALALRSLGSFLLQPDEANILSIAAATHNGQPAYPSLQSPDVSYGIVYGPITFLFFGNALRLAHDHLWILRLLTVSGAFLLALTLYRLAHRHTSVSHALALLALPCALFTQKINTALGLRPDIWSLLALALALEASFLTSLPLAALLTGALLGIALGFKLSFLPAAAFALFLLFRHRGAAAAALALTATTIAVLLPFTLHTFSLPDFVAYLQVTRHEHLDPQLLLLNSLTGLGFLLVPAALRAKLTPELLVFTACLFASVLIGAKPGGGPWHTWQMLPALITCLAFFRPAADSARTNALALIALASLLFTLSNVRGNLADLAPPTGLNLTQARTEIDLALQNHPGQTVEMASGNNPETFPSQLRFMLVERGQPYTVDGSGRVEVNPDPFPPGILESMRACSPAVWLAPRDEKPFHRRIFPKELRSTFLEHYRLESTGAIYETWVCGSPASPVPTPPHLN